MGERSNATIWHEEVEVGNVRRIAARGLIPNYIHHHVSAGEVQGILLAFEHFDNSTVIMVHVDRSRLFVELDLHSLAEIEVTY